MARKITAESLMDEMESIADAKAFAREMRETLRVVTKAHGADSDIAKAFDKRYWDFIDEMTCRINEGTLAA